MGPMVVVVAKRTVELLIALSLAFWVSYWILEPLGAGRRFLARVDDHLDSKFLGAQGSVFIFQAAPILLASILSYILIELRIAQTASSCRCKRQGILRDLRTLMHVVVFAKTPLGVLTVGDLLFLCVILFLVLWNFIKSTYVGVQGINRQPNFPGAPPKWTLKFLQSSVSLASAGLIPFSLLWIPVTRGSPLLRFIRLPWEQAVRYHTWLAQLTLLLFAGHGATFIVFFVGNNEVSHIFNWRTTPGAAVVCGFCALVLGLLMWFTSLPFMRRRLFDLFYSVHQFYVLFFLLFACHFVGAVYYVAIPVLLFFVDRFIRLVQSRQTVDVLSARVLPSGAVELKFPTPENFVYHPLSIVYVLLPSVSRVYWHPFSLTSSPLDGKDQLSICIKPLGGWTLGLTDALSEGSRQSKSLVKSKCPFSFKSSLEGPYGDEVDFYLNYKQLVLVAGGIGITPFLAILRDLLHRYNLEREGLPESITLIYCVRKPSDLAILNTLDPREILPDFNSKVQISVQAYCTSKTIADYPASLENKPSGTLDLETYEGWSFVYSKPIVEMVTPAPIEAGAQTVSLVSGTGNAVWAAAAACAATLGFMILWGLSNVLVIQHRGSHYKNYKESVLFLVSLFLGVVLCGGTAVLLWSFCVRNRSRSSVGCFGGEESQGRIYPQPSTEYEPAHRSPWAGSLHLGLRPVWKDVFGQLTKRFEGQEVGVLVSGPSSLEADVAAECGRHRSSCRTSAYTNFHFHSVSFEL